MATQPFPRTGICSGLQGDNAIGFYGRNEPWGFMSNLAESPITFMGKDYPTVEHAYQAGKFQNKELVQWLLQAPRPRHLAQAAHAFNDPDDGIREDWHTVKFSLMRALLGCKFTQNPGLAAELLRTEDKHLYEAGPTSEGVNGHANVVWGVPLDTGRGYNALGRMLMEVREQLFGIPQPWEKTFIEGGGYPDVFGDGCFCGGYDLAPGDNRTGEGCCGDSSGHAFRDEVVENLTPEEVEAFTQKGWLMAPCVECVTGGSG